MNRIRVGRRHQFVDDPAMRDPRTGMQFCWCGLPSSNKVHEVPARSDEEREA